MATVGFVKIYSPTVGRPYCSHCKLQYVFHKWIQDASTIFFGQLNTVYHFSRLQQLCAANKPLLIFANWVETPLCTLNFNVSRIPNKTDFVSVSQAPWLVHPC